MTLEIEENHLGSFIVVQMIDDEAEPTDFFGSGK
jgi:hypothetical protein